MTFNAFNALNALKTGRADLASRTPTLGKTVLAAGLSLMLTACGNLSGLQNASSDFACSVDMPARCQSLSLVHEAIENGTFNESEAQKKKNRKQTQTASSNTASLQTGTSGTSVTTDGTVPDRLLLETPLMLPKRAAEEIVRIWIAPYIDEAGDLHAEHIIFATVRASRWAPESLTVVPQSTHSRFLDPLAVKKPDQNAKDTRTMKGAR